MSSVIHPNVAIVGGGIGGLCLAIGLAKHNIPYHIYEAAHHFAEIGAGVAFGPNAQRAMSLIDPKVKGAYDRRATSNQEDELKDVYFQYRMGMDGRNKAKGRQAGDMIVEPGGPGFGMSIIHRAHFLDELVKLIPRENATFNKKVVDFEDKGAEGVWLHFADGTHANSSIAVGCDGIKSHMRRCLLGEQSDATFTGKYAYRGLVPTSKALPLLGPTMTLNAQAHLGYNGHVLTMPVEKGSLVNVVAFKTKADGKWEDEQWVLPMRWDDMHADFADWGPNVRSILSLMEKPDIWALFDHPPAETYFKGRVALLGDSGHATTPHQGSGAGMAVEDAYILSSLLSHVKDTAFNSNAADNDAGDDIAAVFAAYDAIRRPRTQKLVTTSRAAGLVVEFQSEETGGDDLERVAKNLRERFGWIWEEDLEGNLERARGIFEEKRKRGV